VKLDDVAHTVIGVLPPSFEFTDPVQFWRPLPVSPNAPGQLRIQMIRVFGRLLPGTALEVAQRELDALSSSFWNNLTASFRGPGPGGGERRIVNGPGPQAASGSERRIVGGPGPGESGPQQANARGAPSPRGEQRVITSPGPGPRLPFADAASSLCRCRSNS
jgi:hypothetical protein